jgi:protease-4
MNQPPTGVPPPPPPPRPGVQTVIVHPRRSPWASFAVGCAIVVIILFAIAILGPLFAFMGGGRNLDFASSHGSIALIDVSGEIHTGSGGGGLFREAGASEEIMDEIREAGDDSGIKAIVLDVNSPGGSPAASQAIAEEVRRVVNDKHKPVVAAMGDVAASGAYYISAPCSKIVANPATLTGSIGVRMEVMYFYQLMQKYGVQAEDITSGKFKDMGSPFRPMRPDERQVIEAIITDTYNQFVNDVARGRHMDPAKVRALADGRVYTGTQALQNGLVDSLGNLHDAIQVAADLAGIKGKPTTRSMEHVSGLGALLSSAALLLPKSSFLPGNLPPSASGDLGLGTPNPELRWGDR